jgi:UDP-N-acetylmuramyl pentapeptide phosphotransferase/UDP-N-acetylglucosamine-1-phosphate transferase
MKKFLVSVLTFVAPVVALAEEVDIGYIDSILKAVGSIINTLLPLIIAGAVVWFVWNIARYVTAGDDTAKEQAKDRIIYGVIGLFAMVAVWGLVNLLAGILGVQTGGSAEIPELPQRR